MARSKQIVLSLNEALAQAENYPAASGFMVAPLSSRGGARSWHVVELERRQWIRDDEDDAQVTTSAIPIERAGAAMRSTIDWITRNVASTPTSGTPIERALETAIRLDGRLPLPVAQLTVNASDGSLLTVPDFAYPDEKIAIYCDGFAFHGNVDSLAGDARKRNALQGMGWVVLTFWGRQILREPARCVEAIAEVRRMRQASS